MGMKKILGVTGVFLCSALLLSGCGNTKKETTGENEGVAINHDSQFPIIKEGEELTPVSYTHLTLPTILLV